MTDTPRSQRVWVELELPFDGVSPVHGRGKGSINHALGNLRAELASNMIERLQDPAHRLEGHKLVWWNEKECKYCFTLDQAGTYVTADDHGHWFNLDYFGRPL